MTGLQGNILITGGAGTLGQAIIERARRDKWDCTFTIYSRDPLKHQAMRRKYPECRYVLGDILDKRALSAACAGHDTVIHAAAQKHIPEAEAHPDHCYSVNVVGSGNVLEAAFYAGVKRILAISTDKACWPVNVYGASKFMMERQYQQFALHVGDQMQVNLCRYGNVLGSNGSVLQVWAGARTRGERVKMTDPTMTRFWLNEQRAVDLILYALTQPTGVITIPRLPALSMGRLAEYLDVGNYEVIGLRPGEKMHEMLVTPQEWPFVENKHHNYMTLNPVTGTPIAGGDVRGYTSDAARQLTHEELAAMLEDVPA